MRIAIIGTHSTGKSALALPLSVEMSLPYIGEQARVSIQKLDIKNLDEYRKDKDMFSIFQHDIIRRQINEEAKYQSVGFISDRSTCDNICYYLLNNQDCNEVVNHYKDLALDHYKNNYNLVVYIPIMFSLVNDGVRNQGEEYRKEVDSLIRKYMILNKNLYILKTEGIENRVNEVMEVIKRRNKIDWERLNLVYKRIIDLEDRNNDIEQYKLEELYKLETKLLLGGKLTQEEIARHKLTKYKEEVSGCWKIS